MAKFLVIVESPAKSSTIGGYLGADYQVKSSLGHVRDLPAKQLGIEPQNGWAASYIVSPRHEKVVTALKKAAKNVETVYLATDPDREGEAIAWHLAEVLGQSRDTPVVFRRVVFNEITRTAVKKSFENPRDIDMQLVEAQWSRRFLDRIVGFQLSPLLWKKNMRGTSAGRVQSVALRMLVERERSIRAFSSQEFWEVKVLLEVGGQTVEFALKKKDGKAFRPGSKEEVDEHLRALREHLAAATITTRNERPLTPRPGAPFITSSLQRTASSRLSITLKRTMQLAQSLYEAGLITYMRTDSTHMSAEAVEAARSYIGTNYPPKGEDSYLPDSPRRYASSESAQEGHEAIRPTSVERAVDDLPADIEGPARRLYDLIYRRFIACQMSVPRLLSTRLKVEVGGYEMETQGRVTLFDGFLSVWPEGAGDDKLLPAVQVGDPVQLQDLVSTQQFTQPPRRYNEAALVRELEKNGIGRPSTYADIVSTLHKRGYTSLAKKSFLVEHLGEMVCARLEQHFADLMDYKFTAGLEQGLDRIAAGKVGWKSLLDDFYNRFSKALELAADSERGMKSVHWAVQTEMTCEICKKHQMLLHINKVDSGFFLGCSGYREEEEANKCTATQSLHRILPDRSVVVRATGKDKDAGEDVGNDAGKEKKATASSTPPTVLPRQCPECGLTTLLFQVDARRRLWVCSGSPDCQWTGVEQGNFAEIEGEKKAAASPAIHIKNLPCRKHPEDYYILREGRNGLFLSASGWPKRKETRNILVSELPLVQEQLGEQFAYLFSAPAKDPEGRDTEVVFSKKLGGHYVRTAGLARGQKAWAAMYEQQKGNWKELAPSESSSPAGGRKRYPRKRSED